VFNSYLKLDELRGNAVLAVTTRQNGLRCEPKCSVATIFAMSDQRPASILWTVALLWGFYCFWHYRKRGALVAFGGLAYSEAEGRFYDAKGQQVRLTPMQQQLMEMFFRSDSHQLSKTEICDALWPKKDDANDTLYTLIRRLKPIIEAHSDLKIESDRGRAYELKAR
jgi:DNA-binding response OmpR family regulator